MTKSAIFREKRCLWERSPENVIFWGAQGLVGSSWGKTGAVCRLISLVVVCRPQTDASVWKGKDTEMEGQGSRTWVGWKEKSREEEAKAGQGTQAPRAGWHGRVRATRSAPVLCILPVSGDTLAFFPPKTEFQSSAFIFAKEVLGLNVFQTRRKIPLRLCYSPFSGGQTWVAKVSQEWLKNPETMRLNLNRGSRKAPLPANTLQIFVKYHLLSEGVLPQFP